MKIEKDYLYGFFTMKSMDARTRKLARLLASLNYKKPLRVANIHDFITAAIKSTEKNRLKLIKASTKLSKKYRL